MAVRKATPYKGRKMSPAVKTKTSRVKRATKRRRGAGY